jgi:hypothetical protein
VAKESKMEVAKLRRHFKDVMDKEAKKYISAA